MILPIKVLKSDCIYIEQNMYVEPKGHIIKFESISKDDFPNCNSNGFWGNEKDGIHRMWIDLTIYRNESKR
mgnify:FL=1|jgi:hypothetical protein